MAASREKLELLHDITCDALITLVQSGKANASELAAAIKFLKDNNIEVPIAINKPKLKLTSALPFTDEREAAVG